MFLGGTQREGSPREAVGQTVKNNIKTKTYQLQSFTAHKPALSMILTPYQCTPYETAASLQSVFHPPVLTHCLESRDDEERDAGAPGSAHIPPGRKGWDYLLAQDHLVVKQEEDPLLVAAIRLVDPGHLPGVDQLRAPV